MPITITGDAVIKSDGKVVLNSENTTKMNKVKACPFCGSTDVQLYSDEEDNYQIYSVCCQEAYKKSEQEVIEKWNRRI